MNFYETDGALEQYLLFHYGTPEQICPLLPEARTACGFPARCVSEPLRGIELVRRGRALDLGCAVGRSSLELRRHFDAVVGIDFSHRFVQAAARMAKDRVWKVRVPCEGSAYDEMKLELPRELSGEDIVFEQGDACDLRADLGTFDLVLMANLIDRLPDPARCLARVPELVAPGGWLIITSPYTWLEEYTLKDKWLSEGENGTLGGLQRLLEPGFALRRTLDVPFLIREHRRKYQWSIAEANIWERI
jgi:putative 4-mercaptohistidine N1-methyltranferase